MKMRNARCRVEGNVASRISFSFFWGVGGSFFDKSSIGFVFGGQQGKIKRKGNERKKDERVKKEKKRKRRMRKKKKETNEKEKGKKEKEG